MYKMYVKCQKSPCLNGHTNFLVTIIELLPKNLPIWTKWVNGGPSDVLDLKLSLVNMLLGFLVRFLTGKIITGLARRNNIVDIILKIGIFFFNI